MKLEDTLYLWVKYGLLSVSSLIKWHQEELTLEEIKEEVKSKM